MKTCQKCQQQFNIHLVIDGKRRNLASRKYCIECSPFQKHNTKVLEKEKQDNNHQKCSKCKQVLPCSEFYKNSDQRLHTSCKQCSIKSATERFRVRKKEFIKLKGGKCIVCGYDRYDGALEFHHVDPTVKEFAINKGWRLEKNLQELDKCILLCSNCHRELHGNFIDISKLVR